VQEKSQGWTTQPYTLLQPNPMRFWAPDPKIPVVYLRTLPRSFPDEDPTLPPTTPPQYTHDPRDAGVWYSIPPSRPPKSQVIKHDPPHFPLPPAPKNMKIALPWSPATRGAIPNSTSQLPGGRSRPHGSNRQTGLLYNSAMAFAIAGIINIQRPCHYQDGRKGGCRVRAS
jgi:hypothetical protein